MVPQLPSFLRRRLLLHEARKALLDGSPEEALERLEDPSLALSEEADRLRERVLDVLCREAARRCQAGRADSGLRLLRRVEARDAPRAERWRRRLAEEGRLGRGRVRLSSDAESSIIGALESLLSQMRAKRSPTAGAPESVARALAAAGTARAASNGRHSAAAGSVVKRFHLAVDDAGEFLVVSGDEIVLGHARGGRCDLPFLADLDARHALLRRSESFHGGPGWSLAPAAGQRIELDGQPLVEGARALSDGALVRLAPNLAFRFRTPEPSSGSALLELLRGAECEGAGRVLLLSPGRAGRLRFGARRRRHVRVRGLQQEIGLELEAGELVVSSEAGLRTSWLGVPGEPSAEPQRELRLPCPPPARVDFTSGSVHAGRAPFAFSIRPVAGPASGGGAT